MNFKMKNSLKLATLAFLMLFGKTAVVLEAQKMVSETSDPKAKALLDKVKKLYEGYSSLESSFTLNIKFSEQKKEEIQKGKIYQQGEMYRIELGKQLIMSDGKTVWHKTDNTVRILDATGKKGNDLMSPKDLMKIYEKGDYIYAIMGEDAESWSTKATSITFKPVKRTGDYTQIRVSIDQKTNQIVSMTAFGRDQSRFKLSLAQPVKNKKYTPQYFVFNKAEFPTAKIEDLRID
jgi:outer membrane lipoprotein carrier protein